MELMGTSHINIRYKDITYKKLTKTGVDKFVLDKKVTVQIREKDRNDEDEIDDKKIMTIQSNDIDMKFHIEDDRVYNNIIRRFEEAIAEIKHALLNKLNTPTIPANIGARIGSYLTGYSGTIPEQRAQIGERPEIREHGGKRKTRKQRRQRK